MTPPNPDPASVLARWHAEEAAIRSTMLAPGTTPPAQVSAMRGIEFLRAWLAGQLPPPTIGASLDFLLVGAEEGRVTFQGKPGAAFYNPLATVHGGWIAAILDSAVGCAVHSMLPAGRAYTTAELKINYVRAVTSTVPLLRAEGKVIHMGGRMATADGQLVGADGKLYAHASTTCFVFEAAGTG